MFKRFGWLFWLLIWGVVPASLAQTAALTGYCNLGGVPAKTSGLSSTNNLQGVIPKCTVTVYLTGTQTLATIYADGSSTPLANPFTATTMGQWTFFSAVNVGYDVVLSGGVSPNIYPSPVTLTGLYPGFSFSGGGTAVTLQTNGSPNSSQSILNLKSGGQLTVTNTSGGDVQVGGGPFDLQGAAGMSGFTVTVAASNSVNKASANIICSGTSDDVCLTNALALCPNSVTSVAGCRVALQDGKYNISAPIPWNNDDIDFGGINHCMWGGYFRPINGSPGGIPPLPVGALGTGCAQLIAGPGVSFIIQGTNTLPCGTGADTGRCRGGHIHDLYFIGYNYTGTAIGISDNSDHVIIDDNVFQRLNLGMGLHLDSPVIKENSCQDMIGCLNLSGEYGQTHDNLFFDITGTAIQVESIGSIVHDNTIGDCLQIGINLAGSWESAHGNVIRNCSSPVVVNLGSVSDKVENNTIYYGQVTNPTGSAPAITVADGSGHLISGNIGYSYYSQPNYFVSMGSATNSSITNNNVSGPWNYGGTAFSLGSSSNISGLNLASFAPAAGPAVVTSASLQAAWVASSITGVTSGSPITVWPDSSGFTNTLTPSTSAPLYIAASPINGLPAVQFNGTTQFATANGSGEAVFPPTAPKTIFAVVSLTGLGKVSTMATSTSGTATNSLSFDTTNHLASFAGTYVVSTLPTVTTATTYVVMLVNNGASSRLAQNGASQTVNNGSNIWSLGAIVGANGVASSEFFPGYIAAEYIYTGAMTTGDAAAVGAALCSTYGVTCGSSW